MIISEEHLDYLDCLRESGVTNMWGASVYIEEEFGLDRKEAKELLSHWMKTFSKRHPK